jgi:hypothetical protein
VAGGKGPAEPRYVHVQPLRAARRWRTRPQLLNQLIARHDLVRPQQQQSKHGSRHPPAQGELTPIVTDCLQRTQDPETHTPSRP